MGDIDGIYSTRLVIADFYMEKPVLGLDPCYSELRGKEIKRVPIVRVFGANANGQKTCLHIHGVFPYFYIPYDKKDFESVDRGIFQIAMHLDKAINISLGQGSSNAQHVFKIQLVKGIPFYGYHRAEHQYLKIYMFNPRFVRRAANLLQSGAILNKNFSPHESHVPYILQFMIDYNLYGMSYLHVPLEVVKFRRNNEEELIPYANVRPQQLLDPSSVKKVACSSLELDISSNFILNRFQLVIKSNTNHTNPGIEAIWHDEKMRRQKLAQVHTVPVLEVPPTQDRPNIEIAESDIFYRTALQSKLLATEHSIMSASLHASDHSTSCSTHTNNSLALPSSMPSTKEQRRTFNLQKLLVNAVYPEECTQAQQQLVNASFIQNHLSNSSSFNCTIQQQGDNEAQKDQDYLDDTLVDEELVLSLTQPQLPTTVPHDATLSEEDLQLLDVLQQLEEENDNDAHIDLDSSLAPLSQPPQKCTPETQAAVTAVKQPHADAEAESEDEMAVEDMHDFSIAMDDIDELLLKLTQSQPTQQLPSQSVPQIDGADDLLPRTPNKRTALRQGTPPSTPVTPKSRKKSIKSPRTPKSSAAKKYAPLPLTFSTKATPTDYYMQASKTVKSQHSSPKKAEARSPSISLRKRLAMSELRRKSISTAAEVVQDVPGSVEKTPVCRRSLRNRNLNKTHISCSLKPRNKNTRFSDVFEVVTEDQPARATALQKAHDEIEDCIVAIEKQPRRSARNAARQSAQHAALNVNSQTEEAAKCVISQIHDDSKASSMSVEAAQPSLTPLSIGSKANVSEDEEIISDTESDMSTLKLRKTPNLKRLRRSFRETLLARRATPTATTSNDIPIDKSPLAKVDKQTEHITSRCSPNLDRVAMSSPRTPQLSGHSEDAETPELMKSFYEHSLLINSPSVFGDDLYSPGAGSTSSPQLPRASSNSSNSAAANSVVITALQLPPSYDEVLQGCRKLSIHAYEFQNPFYSNPADLTKMKEVGFLVLQIPGNKLNDCEEFNSVLDDSSGLEAWRRKQLISIGGPAMLQRFRGAQRIREYFSCTERVTIEPACAAPSWQDAKVWLKARELLRQGKRDDGHTAETEQPNDADSPIKIKRQKITMMLNDVGAASDDEDLDCSGLALTPMTPGTLTPRPANDTLTPVTSNAKGSVQRRRRKRGTKLSFKQCSAMADALNDEPTDSSQSQSLKSSQSSEPSVSSSVALAELERSSFARQLQDDAAPSELSFGLTNATLDNTFGFKVNLENLQQAKADIECNYLTIITLELFVPTRDELQPDPLHDEIRCIFYAIEHSLPQTTHDTNTLPSKACGYIIVNDAADILSEGCIHGIDADIEVQVVLTEAEALEALLVLCARWDADIYAGYEIEMASWGYVIERAKHLCFNIAPLLSRVPSQKVRDVVDEDREQFTDLDVEMKICGRILLDVWRLMRSEIALTSYSFENVMYHILHKRCPWHSHRSLTAWFASPCSRWITIEYYLERVRGTLALLDQLDLLGRTSEMAKLIGIQFYEVLSRGSQFRVESMMLRIAKPKNLVPLSPSVQQRAHMRAPEYLALIMEPQSRFYADPVIVLDFQSLYPSMIIAYNYCFSTCLGRVEHLGHNTLFEFGASQLRVSHQMLQKLLERDLITVSPCGVVFVKSNVREGILSRMLSEILDTRQMVKQSMKVHKNNSALQRILHSRQLGLKLMANVTYGYTAANFSGRMPCVEVGDSVVSKGRETLERAIKLVESNAQWNVRVVYGDTDSMFVLAAGRSRAEAFKIGEQIAEAVTNINPHPVKLKLEKVYQPCILQTKKRYVGYMYETAEQPKPVYEAKGIETVRRDGCPAVAKMLEKVLRILFETADVSQVKQYVCRQFTKLLSGRANLQDLIFAKEFRGLNGYKPTACVPALEMTRKWLQKDPRHIPRRGERVPFVIVNGPPGVPLIRLVHSPHELLGNAGYKINAIYYITKAIIPPLNRCLLLIGADVNEWFSNLPRKLLLTPALSTGNELIMPAHATGAGNPAKKSTISQYFSTTSCVIDCGRQTKAGICQDCLGNASKCVITLHDKIGKLERSYQLTQQICQSCCGRVGDLKCASLDCPVLYVAEVKRRDLPQIVHFRKLIEERF